MPNPKISGEWEGEVGVVGDYGDELAELVAANSIDVPDFPQPGIIFKDLSPLFANGAAFRTVVDAMAGLGEGRAAGGFDVVAGVEARGFLLAAAIGYATGTGVVPVRKAGKLPRSTHAESYALEYGFATLEVHTDAFVAGQRVLVVDDVLATGGTAAAAIRLVEQAGGTVVAFVALLELGFLAGRARLAGREVRALLAV